MSTYGTHLDKAESVLDRLRIANIRIHVKKPSFVLHEIDYLEYVLSRDGIKP